MDLAAQQQSEREQKIGRRLGLLQQQENLRINADAILQSAKDAFGIRDVEYMYVEQIDFKKLKFLVNEAQMKVRELAKIGKEIAALNAALGDQE